MNRKNTVTINKDFINDKIEELNLKKSWIAQKIGVDRKTISRWTTGKVKRITKYNAKELAKCLESSLDQITISVEIHNFKDFDRESAVEEMITEDLLLLLSPTGNWKLIESIIKSSIDPSLSECNLGKMYNWLSITKWRKREYDDARAFAERALGISEKIGENGIRVKSLFNLGTIESLRGNNEDALEFYKRCYENKEDFTNIVDRASLCTNLSMVYRDMAYFKESLVYQREAIELFQREHREYNLSIAYQCLGYIFTEIGELEKAIENYDIALKYAEKTNYKNGKIFIQIYKLDALVLNQEFHRIDNPMKDAIEAYLNGGKEDPFCFEYIARYYRMVNEFEEAERIVLLGLEDGKHNPTAMGSLWHERGRLEEMKKSNLSKEYIIRGNDIYRKTGLLRRVFNGEIKEYGSMFQ